MTRRRVASLAASSTEPSQHGGDQEVTRGGGVEPRPKGAVRGWGAGWVVAWVGQGWGGVGWSLLYGSRQARRTSRGDPGCMRVSIATSSRRNL